MWHAFRTISVAATKMFWKMRSVLHVFLFLKVARFLMFFSNHSARFSFVVRLAHHIFCPQSAAMRLFLAMSFRKTYFFFSLV